MTSTDGPPLRAEDLGKHYGRGWALRDCTLELPAERVVALVGPNGAGKTTLIGLATGLLAPSEGSVRVFGRRPGGRGLPPEVAYLSQRKPLYPDLTVTETLHLGRRLNPTWDQAYAQGLVTAAGVPLKARVGTLSGGQRTRVAIALALGKRPRLVLLDEPLADLDPLARQDTLRTLLGEARREGITVVLSSHVLAELQAACDHLVLLGGGRVRLAGDVERLLAEHWLLTTGARAPAPRGEIVDVQRDSGQVRLLVRTGQPSFGPPWTVSRPGLEDIVLGHMRAARQTEVAA
ncbi:ABC-2 type transport system ATP-binding protein [Crossiella equi]|uniref:ABC-2 type transport system ATP-binding protein n=1 Tax=Crossiella equi TaxID=130796 RepID=A0ABS5A4Q8_9PSEU|nr:ABC transporter ATP-binding protein [Crossiella equi]MBP2471562.1 ABC-2 type transport system ATP-binding protein [Crossiella equi]